MRRGRAALPLPGGRTGRDVSSVPGRPNRTSRSNSKKGQEETSSPKARTRRPDRLRYSREIGPRFDATQQWVFYLPRNRSALQTVLHMTFQQSATHAHRNERRGLDDGNEAG